MNADEQKGYRKGYAAGRRKLENDASREQARKGKAVDHGQVVP